MLGHNNMQPRGLLTLQLFSFGLYFGQLYSRSEHLLALELFIYHLITSNIADSRCVLHKDDIPDCIRLHGTQNTSMYICINDSYLRESQGKHGLHFFLLWFNYLVYLIHFYYWAAFSAVKPTFPKVLLPYLNISQYIYLYHTIPGIAEASGRWFYQ